jgi:hypothetical protein
MKFSRPDTRHGRKEANEITLQQLLPVGLAEELTADLSICVYLYKGESCNQPSKVKKLINGNSNSKVAYIARENMKHSHKLSPFWVKISVRATALKRNTTKFRIIYPVS